MSRIKICGLRRLEDIAAVNEARPDYCGFIVEYPKSRRSIDRATLRELVRGLREEIVPVVYLSMHRKSWWQSFSRRERYR